MRSRSPSRCCRSGCGRSEPARRPRVAAPARARSCRRRAASAWSHLDGRPVLMCRLGDTLLRLHRQLPELRRVARRRAALTATCSACAVLRAGVRRTARGECARRLGPPARTVAPARRRVRDPRRPRARGGLVVTARPACGASCAPQRRSPFALSAARTARRGLRDVRARASPTSTRTSSTSRPRSLLCTCRPCYLLFTREGAGRGNYRAVPDRYLTDDGADSPTRAWDELQVPVAMAFFFEQLGAGPRRRAVPEPGRRHRVAARPRAWDVDRGEQPARRRAWRPTSRRSSCAARGGQRGLPRPDRRLLRARRSAADALDRLRRRS